MRCLELFDLDKKIEVMDIGAAAIAEEPIYSKLIGENIANLNAFEGDDRQMKDIPYVQMTQNNTAVSAEGRSQSPYNANFKEDFSDFEFSEEGINEFATFKIKIVMKGTNPAYPPRLTDMRAIALAV